MADGQQTEAYPLQWPIGRQRTHRLSREPARFDVSFARARDNVTREVQLLVGRYARDPMVVISTDIPLRRDGLPLANQRTPDDVGVAVYFIHKKRQMCFACDRWQKVEHNMQAIAKTIEALRGIARWGTGDMLESAFTGFIALPSLEKWWQVLGIELSEATPEKIESAYRRLAMQNHPDRGGNEEAMSRINIARDEGLRAGGMR